LDQRIDAGRWIEGIIPTDPGELWRRLLLLVPRSAAAAVTLVAHPELR
jgi:hypothetical protein